MRNREERHHKLLIEAANKILSAMKELQERNRLNQFREGELGILYDALSCIIKRVEIDEYPV